MVSRVIPPEASTAARPSIMATPLTRSVGAKLSSSTTSAPPVRTSSIWSSRSTSTTMHAVCGIFRRSSRSARGRDAPPAVRTARWLSLSITASESPKRWLCPPPHVTACFSSARRPGVVLRVSHTRVRVMVPAGSLFARSTSATVSSTAAT